jgi:DNA mismatch repair protein MSH2
MSLFGLLNRCQTSQGSRLLNQYIRQPLVDKSLIENRLDLLELLIHENELDLGLRENLRNFPDLVRLCKKLQRGSANIQVSNY